MLACRNSDLYLEIPSLGHNVVGMLAVFIQELFLLGIWKYLRLVCWSRLWGGEGRTEASLSL